MVRSTPIPVKFDMSLLRLPTMNVEEPVEFRFLLKNKPYIFLILANSILFFIVSGIQYWATFYLINVLKVEEKSANILFGTTAITAPIFGAIASSVLSTCFGGFESNKILPTCFVLSLVGILAGVIMPEVKDHLVAVALIWVLLFVGTITFPMHTGVMLT